MGVVNFIIDNVLTQASITIALIAMMGLLLQKKGDRTSYIGYFKNAAWFPSIKCRFQHHCRQLGLLWGDIHSRFPYARYYPID